MSQVQRKTVAGEEPAPAFLDPAELPDEYGMRVLGDCMLPEIADNALLHFDKREPVKAGDTVIIYRRPEIVPEGQPQAQVKRLVLAIPDWVTFPWRDNPKSEVLPLIIAEQLNPPRQYYYQILGRARRAQVHGAPAG